MIKMEGKESTNSETLVPDTVSDRHLNGQNFEEEEEEEEEVRAAEESKQLSFDQKEILRSLEVLERDSLAVAESFTSLFASLRLALSQVTSRSVDHMHCFNDAAGRLQECALDAATRGNRLNEEMKDMDGLARQLKSLRRNVDAMDSAVNRLLRLP